MRLTMLNINKLNGFGVGSIITKVAEATSSLSTIVVPSSVGVGQLIVLFQRAVNTSGTPATVTPSGFTSANVATLTTNKIQLSYKLSDGSEGGTTLSGMNGTSTNRKILLVFGYANCKRFNSVTLNQAEGQITDGTPTNQVKTFSGVISPSIVVLGARGDGVQIAQMSPLEDGELTEGGITTLMKYKIYQGNPQTTTLSLADGGTFNSLQSCYFTVT